MRKNVFFPISVPYFETSFLFPFFFSIIIFYFIFDMCVGKGINVLKNWSIIYNKPNY